MYSYLTRYVQGACAISLDSAHSYNRSPFQFFIIVPLFNFFVQHFEEFHLTCCKFCVLLNSTTTRFSAPLRRVLVFRKVSVDLRYCRWLFGRGSIDRRYWFRVAFLLWGLLVDIVVILVLLGSSWVGIIFFVFFASATAHSYEGTTHPDPLTEPSETVMCTLSAKIQANTAALWMI